MRDLIATGAAHDDQTSDAADPIITQATVGSLEWVDLIPQRLSQPTATAPGTLAALTWCGHQQALASLALPGQAGSTAAARLTCFWDRCWPVLDKPEGINAKYSVS